MIFLGIRAAGEPRLWSGRVAGQIESVRIPAAAAGDGVGGGEGVPGPDASYRRGGHGRGKSLAYLVPSIFSCAGAGTQGARFNPHDQFAGAAFLQGHSARAEAAAGRIQGGAAQGTAELSVPTAAAARDESWGRALRLARAGGNEAHLGMELQDARRYAFRSRSGARSGRCGCRFAASRMFARNAPAEWGRNAFISARARRPTWRRCWC